MTKYVPHSPSTEESTNPKDKIGRTKPALHLIPGPALVQEAVVMKLGADKYGEYNWRGKTVSASVYVSAALRHLHAWYDGENLDPESNASHLAHARACMGIILDAEAQGTLVDDRPVPGATADLIQLETVLNQANKQDTDQEKVEKAEPGTAVEVEDVEACHEPIWDNLTATEAAASDSVLDFDHLKNMFETMMAKTTFPPPTWFNGFPVHYVDKLDDRTDALGFAFHPLNFTRPIPVKLVETPPRVWYNNQQGETSQNLEEVTVRPRKLDSDESRVTVRVLENQGCRTSVAHEIASGVSVPSNNKIKGGVYVAGPMRGYHQFNFPAFDGARDRLVEQGWLVISPADIDRASGVDEEDAETTESIPQPVFTYRDFHSLYSLDGRNGDAIAMLPGWEKSTGAVAEFFLARWLGLKVIDALTGLPLRRIRTGEIYDQVHTSWGQ